MKRSFATAALIVSTSLLVGCPSKDNAAASGATSPSSSTSGGAGPLANLEAAPYLNEVWIAQEGGAQMPFVFYPQQNVRVSASCRPASGQLACDAIRYLRGGSFVEVPRSSLTGNVSAGTRACTKLGHRLVSGHNASGSEDGFCRFPDGSMLSTGALEQYGMRVTE
jgi:putative hemolysin